MENKHLEPRRRIIVKVRVFPLVQCRGTQGAQENHLSVRLIQNGFSLLAVIKVGCWSNGKWLCGLMSVGCIGVKMGCIHHAKYLLYRHMEAAL